MKYLIHGGIRPSTRRVYSSSQRQYLKFCDHYGLCSLPVSENSVLLYIAHLYLKGLKSATMKVYLASVRMFHIESGYDYPLEHNVRIKLALRAVEIGQPPPKQKLPITLTIMYKMYYLLQTQLSRYNVRLIWTAMCLAHFGCLRAGEFTVNQKFNSEIHLSRYDIMFVNKPSSGQQKHIVLHLKRSKTDIQNTGVDIIIGCTGQIVCPYCSMLDYCRVRDSIFPDTSALFIYQNGEPLSRDLLVKNTRIYIATLGMNPNDYSGHSYRIGGATSAGISGLKDWEIQKLGRWRSNVYLRYVQPSNSHFSNFASRITIN